MSSINDRFDLSENRSDTSDRTILSQDDSSLQMHRSSSNDSITEQTYRQYMNEYVDELKLDLQRRCQLNWWNKFECWKHAPKIELNLHLHGAIQDRTLQQWALTKGIPLTSSEHILADIVRVSTCLAQ
jgi:hypothetical protein